MGVSTFHLASCWADPPFSYEELPSVEVLALLKTPCLKLHALVREENSDEIWIWRVSL
jgi:hypothetical protein